MIPTVSAITLAAVTQAQVTKYQRDLRDTRTQQGLRELQREIDGCARAYAPISWSLAGWKGPEVDEFNEAIEELNELWFQISRKLQAGQVPR